jgi:hypothetical protein
MNVEQVMQQIFDGSIDPDASYFDITEEERNEIAKKLISMNLQMFKEDTSKILFYSEYFQFMRDKATELELYETSDLYNRLIEILFQETIDF